MGVFIEKSNFLGEIENYIYDENWINITPPTLSSSHTSPPSPSPGGLATGNGGVIDEAAQLAGTFLFEATAPPQDIF